MFLVALEVAKISLTIAIILEVVSNGWRFMETKSSIIMNWDSAKEVRYCPATIVDSISRSLCCSTFLCWSTDCDFDSDCGIGLVCYQREAGGDSGAVPTCVGNANIIGFGDDDFCIPRPSSNTLMSVFENDVGAAVGGGGVYPIPRCAGDCDSGE